MIAKCIICQFPISVEDENPDYQITECDDYELGQGHVDHIAHLICTRKIEADAICSWNHA